MFPGKLLEEIRKSKGLTRVALAAAAGTYESTICRYELEASANPTWELLVVICMALEVSPEVFYRAAVEAAKGCPCPSLQPEAPPASPPVDLAPLVAIGERQTELLERIVRHIGA